MSMGTRRFPFNTDVISRRFPERFYGGSVQYFNILGSGYIFSRASEASYFTQPPTDDEGDVAGKAFMAWSTANNVRIDSRDGTPMVLLEGAKTNYFTTARDLGSYTTSGVRVTASLNTDGAPDGDASSARIQMPIDDYYYKATTALTSQSLYTISQWLRGVSGQTDPMVTRYSPGPDGASTVGSPPTTLWRQESVRRVPTAAALNAYANDARNTSGIGGLVAGARDGMQAMPQIEGGTAAAGAFATSWIRTTGIAVTRASDRLEFVSGTYPSSMLEKGFSFDVCPIFSKDDLLYHSGSMTLFGIAGGITDCLRFSGTSLAVYIGVGGSARISIPFSSLNWSANQKITITVSPSAGTLEFSGLTSGNGIYTGSAWATNWMPLHSSSNLFIGSRSGTSEQFYARFSQNWRLL